MKSYILLILTSLLCFQSQAQKVRFTDTTNVWYVMNTYNVASQGHAYVMKREKFYFSQSVQYNGHIWQQMSVFNSYYQNTKNDVVLVRDDTANSRVIALDSSGEFVLYEFSLNVGDTFVSHYPTYDLNSGKYSNRWYEVTQIDSVMINNIAHKRFIYTALPDTVTGMPGSGTYYIYEGIGSWRYPAFTMGGNRGVYEFDKIQEYLVCFNNNGQVPSLFTKCQDTLLSVTNDLAGTENKISIYPQPAYDVVHIKLPKAIKGGTLVLYNGMGQTVQTEQFTNRSELTISRPASGTGVYFYCILSNGDSPNRYSGRLLFR